MEGSTVAAGLVFSLVDAELPSHEFEAIEGINRLLGLIVVRHLDKAESLRLAGVAVDDDVDRRDLAVLGEQVAKLILGGAVIHVADINLLGHSEKPRLGCHRRTTARIRPPRADVRRSQRSLSVQLYRFQGRVTRLGERCWGLSEGRSEWGGGSGDFDRRTPKTVHKGMTMHEKPVSTLKTGAVFLNPPKVQEAAYTASFGSIWVLLEGRQLLSRYFTVI